MPIKILDFFFRESDIPPGPLVLTIIFSALSNSALIIIINMAAEQIANHSLETQLFLLFIAVFALFVYTQNYAQKNISITIEKIILKLRVRIADKIRHADLNYIEHNGIGKLYTQLGQNSEVLSEAAVQLTFATQSTILMLVCISYLGWLSPFGFILYCVFFGVGMYIYVFYIKEIRQKISQARKTDAAFLDTLNHILGGFKELKFHQAKSNAVLDELKTIAKNAEVLKSDVKRGQVMLMVYSRSMLYLLLAVMVFLVPMFSAADSVQIHELVATNLFIIGPINVMLHTIPVLSQVNVALENLETLETELDSVAEQEPAVWFPKEFKSLRLMNIGYHYKDRDGDTLFSVQSINFTLERGEILFIVGGNGSGKTTFLKLFSGLYFPAKGYIEWNGKPVTREDYPRYRQWFATVFTDFHLFDKLYGLSGIASEQVEELLEEMELSHKTDYHDGRFSHTDLSTGQRKRLAYISAYLEDKPIYIFDELAADQDPHFRKRFYEEILPDLKALGKTIVAVTHDDKYFSVADRVLKMDSGSFVPYKH